MPDYRFYSNAGESERNSNFSDRWTSKHNVKMGEAGGVMMIRILGMTVRKGGLECDKA